MCEESSSMKGVEALIINNEDVRIGMVGKTGAGKSATGNTILGWKAFPSKLAVESLTVSCKKVTGLVAGRNVVIVDTPGLFDTRFSEDQTFQEVEQCISFSAPGPHVFLIVIKLGRFTKEEERTVEMLQEGFGEMSKKYTMILFTGADQVDEDESVEDILNDSPKLRELIRKCEGRYHVFNNKTKDPSQVTELLEKINNMVLENGGSHYTTEMYQEAEREIQAEKERILKETEEKRRKEEEEMKKKYEEELQKELEKQMKEHKDKCEQERIRKEAYDKHQREVKEMNERHAKEARDAAERQRAENARRRKRCTIL